MGIANVIRKIKRDSYGHKIRIFRWAEPRLCGVMSTVTNKTVLITGASSGIGRQLAMDYALAGATVYACGRNLAALTLLEQEVVTQQLSSRVIPLIFDHTQREQVLAAAVGLKKLDLLILNAGTCEYIDDVRHFDSLAFERVISTNLIGTGYCLEAFLPRLNKGGRLALMGSSASLLPFTRAQAYGASKAGLDYLAQSLAVDLRAEDIGVSLIRPCFVATSLTDKNDFPMPGKISVNAASKYIRRGLQKGKSQIEFTPIFIFTLKVLRFMPAILWTKLQQRPQGSAV